MPFGSRILELESLRVVTTEARTPMPFGNEARIRDSIKVTTEARTPMPFG